MRPRVVTWTFCAPGEVFGIYSCLASRIVTLKNCFVLYQERRKKKGVNKMDLFPPLQEVFYSWVSGLVVFFSFPYGVFCYSARMGRTYVIYRGHINVLYRLAVQ